MRSRSWREPTLAAHLNGQSLSIHRFFFRFALSGANIFAWIFIFQYFYLVEPDSSHALVRTALLYALSQTVTCLMTPYAARLLRSGTRRSLILATLIAATSFILLGAAFEGFWGGAYVPVALSVFAIGLGIYRALYWIPYEVEATATEKMHPSVWSELLITLPPVISGAYVGVIAYGPVWLLYVGAALMLVSAVPLMHLTDIHENFSWKYRETFGQLIDPANRAIIMHSFFEGVAGAALLLFWPLAVFLITGWSYGMLGVVLTFTFLVAVLGRSFVRKGLRTVGLHTSGVANVLFAVTPWMFRMLTATPLGAIAVDSYFYTTTPRRIGVDPLTFEQAADAGSFVDEYTALKEMALSLGRIALSVVGAAAALTLSFPAAFILVFLAAALASAAIALGPR